MYPQLVVWLQADSPAGAGIPLSSPMCKSADAEVLHKYVLQVSVIGV
jgi:hypothetical protein